MAYTVSGTVTIQGAPAPDASNVVKIWADDGAGDGDLIDTVDISGGAGAFTCTVPDAVRNYFAVYDDGTFRGVSALDTPSGSASWSVDATSGYGVPNDLAEWTSLTAGVGMNPPGYLWLCQEAAGNLADSIGAATLTATNSPAYQQAIGGWTRRAVSGTGDGVGDEYFQGTLPNINANSVLFLGYVNTESGASRDFITWGQIDIRSGVAQWTLRHGANVTNMVNNHVGSIHPILVAHNRTAGTIKIYTDLEKYSGTYDATAAGTAFILYGQANGLTNVYEHLIAGAWTGADAEINDATAKALLQALGWTIPWT